MGDRVNGEQLGSVSAAAGKGLQVESASARRVGGTGNDSMEAGPTCTPISMVQLS